MQALHPDFAEFLSLLSAKDVKYTLIGGYAVAAHGHPRNTGDMDVFYEANAENAARIVAALAEFGFPPPTVEQLLSEFAIFRMGEKPVMIELTNGIDGVTFEEVYQHRVIARFGDLAVPMIDLVRLRKNKAASARPKDLADLSQLPEA